MRTAARAMARSAHRVARRRARRVGRGVLSRWRRSLQLRVVATTMVLSLSVVALLGFFLMQQIQSGLLRAKEDAALFRAYAGLRTVQERLGATHASDAQAKAAMLNQLVYDLAGPTDLYEVIIIGGPGSAAGTFPVLGRASGFSISPSSIPERLQQAVRATGTANQRYTYTTLYYEGGTRSVPGLVVGAPAGSYQLYYLFPLGQEVETLALVRGTLVTAGAALVVLLAGIAYLVTRQVVTPVRTAARTAERLAAGRLEERMQVRGEDDLARLATSFNEMATSLQEQIRQLEELSRVQRRFVSDVSHELRTPLSTIRVAADVVHEARESFEPAVSRSAELLQTQVDRFEALLSDLLEVSRHDAGAAVLESESVDLRELVLHTVGDAEALAERTGSRIVQRMPDEPCTAEVDRRRVERILRNLLVNAIEHGEGRDVIVTAAFDRDAVAVAVRDHGVGLADGDDALVFDRFWRADPARARGTGGTGLGLSISSEDAGLHGGWLQAWGRPGMGAQFRLSLPRVAGQELRGSPLPLLPVDAPVDAPVGTRSPNGGPPALAPAEDVFSMRPHE